MTLWYASLYALVAIGTGLLILQPMPHGVRSLLRVAVVLAFVVLLGAALGRAL
jgi:hypothetical protein